MRKCEKCGKEINERTANRFYRAWEITDTCDVCISVMWDDIEWLTGTGRYGQ